MGSTIKVGPEVRSVTIPVGVMLQGDLVIPANVKGIVVFAHGSGSSRLSSRNRRVAARLQRGGFATMLFDLLTADEELLDASTGQFRFDVSMLGERLVKVTDWLESQPGTRALRVGYFGASTGAAAAIIAAANRPEVCAVVSRGGRPDLAGPFLGRVKAPTLLIVGGADTDVIGMNQSALRQLASAPTKLEIVPGATHLFEEPGTLERVAELAMDWFDKYLASNDPADQDEIC